MSASASAAAASLKSQYARTGPCGADTVAKYVGRSQPDKDARGMGYKPSKAAECLHEWDSPGAAEKNGPTALKGY
jgi:hypothetical protein